MDFHLEFPVPPLPGKIAYHSPLFFTGSCFSENIGSLFNRYKFPTFINPNGTLYDPDSIARSLSAIIDNKRGGEAELFFHQDRWHCWDHHSSFSSAERQVCLDTIKESQKKAKEFLGKASFLFISFGSAYVYRHKKSGKRVANCHKVPREEFTKELLSVEEIVEAYSELTARLHTFNPNLLVVYTVSPVRYIRDGAVENTLSKSVLIQAVHTLVQRAAKTAYFPAYELVMDDLRDYRFFKSDLVHPTEQAVQYVFDKLAQASFDSATRELFEQVVKIVQAKEHRPFDPKGIAHQKFKKACLEKCKELQAQHPELDLTGELHYFTEG